MAQFNPGILNEQKTVLDRQRLQQAFEQQKAMQALQMAAQIKSMEPKPDTLSLKDRLEFAFKERELAQKANMGALTTDPGMGGGYVPMNFGQMDDLTSRQIQVESGGDPFAISPAGAQGLMQIMPDTARDPGYGVTPLQGWDGRNPMTAPPQEQIRFGQDYLNAMIQKNGGDTALGLASYNAGPGAVEKYGGIPPYKETQDYVQKIAGSMSPATAKPLYQGGKIHTAGLPAGYQWVLDGQGKQIAQRIPGTEKEDKPLTESQDKTALFADRLREADPVILSKGNAATRGQRFLDAVPFVGNSLVSDEYQQLDQAKRNFINATLRRESGAVISDTEFDNADKQYFPQPGDGPDVLAQKAANRQTVINGFARGAGAQYAREFEAQPELPMGSNFLSTPSGVKYREIK